MLRGQNWNCDNISKLFFLHGVCMEKLKAQKFSTKTKPKIRTKNRKNKEYLMFFPRGFRPL